MVDLTPIVQAIIVLIGTLITAFLIPFIKSKTNIENLLTDREKQSELETWISIAVAAAEQLFKGEGQGPTKKDYVINFLSERGYVVDSTAISKSLNALIEASVYHLKN